MRKVFVAVILIVLMASATLADVLYLKDGSLLRGDFVGYENGKFIFETGGNRMEFRPDQVLRLVIERGDRRTLSDRRPPRDTSNPPNSPGERPELIRTIDVKLEDQWFRSQIEVARGQHVRVEASGTIYLEGRTATGPEGLRERRDPDSPMPEQNDGALIAAIGQDPNSPPIFIGGSSEFTADRDGVLYFTINHWETRDARGSFRVNVILDRSGGGARVAGSRPDQGRGAADGGSRPGQAREKTITIYANQPWVDTGIDVEPNMTFSITAEGTIELDSRNRSDPDGNPSANNRTASYPMNDVAAGALIGKIRYRDGRDSNFVFIGSHGEPTTEPNEYGRLFLGINDDYFRDNNGSYKVTIRW
ncbi:MAG: hypothetical protein J2P52_08195 [Blastocatellia bacterium]|nr:hypothetical protein [Blastocatellia bacterium]